LKYLGLIGNVFSQAAIDKCISRIDPGFGTSKSGVVVYQYLDGRIHVIHAEEYDRPDYATMIKTIEGPQRYFSMINLH
jgi:hypothetical protein